LVGVAGSSPPSWATSTPDTTRGYVLISPHAAALPVEQISRLAVAVS
jgi:hypothetical protein